MRAGIVSYLFTLVTLLLPFQTQAQDSRQALHGHVRSAVSGGQAALVGSLPETQRLQATIVLPPRNQSELNSLLSRIYNPFSPDYHHFLGVDQFTEQFAPTQEDYRAVVNFAKANGLDVTSTPANRMIVPVSGSVDQIEKTFHVRINVYRHPTENRTFYSPDREPSLDLAVPVAHIAGLNNFSVPRPLVKRSKPEEEQKTASVSTAGSGPGGSYLASDIRAAYYGGTALTGAGQTVALLEYDGYLLSDVNKTFSSAGQSYSVPIKNVLLDGETGKPNSGSDVEDVADIVQVIGMAPGLSQVRVYIGNVDIDILNAIASDDLANQISISWSWVPDDPATDNIFFMEFAAQGQSVFVASGDTGSYDPLWSNFYPAESDFVTAVGGTDLVTSSPGGPWASETAWTGSGGGISPDRMPIPSWQSKIANSSNQASTALRNVPDVAMESEFDYACNMGECGTWAGTSFAAPRWAGFMALVNQQNANAGNPSEGFLNPALYAIGKGSGYGTEFHDIVVGNNNYENDCCGWPYYNAVPGYDLVTGWGSPAGQDLIDALVPKTPPSFDISAPGDMVIYPGNFNSDILTITRHGGFNGPVQLAISGLPAGVTATVDNPVPAPAGQYVAVIFSANSSAEPGSYLLKVTGTSGSLIYTTPLALRVGSPFSMYPSPSKVTIPPGGAGSSVIFMNGAASSVSLAVTSGLPSGVTASWLTDPQTGLTALVLSASNSVPLNTHARLTITGVSDGQTETVGISLIIAPPQPYLSVSPAPTAIAQGASYTSIVTVAPPGNYGGPLVLSAAGLPRGVTATFNPASTSTTSKLTLTASSSAPIGTSSVTIQGTTPSGFSTVYTFPFPLSITAKPAPAFALGASLPSLAIGQGASVQDTISINATGGFTSPVNLSIVDGVPIGVTATFSANPATGNSVLTFTANSPALPGIYRIVIYGVSGNLQSATTLYLTVNPPPAFSLSSSSASLTVNQGSSVTDTISVNPGTGFSGNVSLSVVSLPAGVTASFGTNPTSGKSLFTLQASSTTLPGNYMLMISGTCNGFTATTMIPLKVQFAAPIQTSTTLSPFSASPYPGGAAYTLTATVAPVSGSEAVPGNVIFHIGSATQIVPLSALNIATYKGTAQNAPGSLTVSADYQGSSDFFPSSSSVLTEPIAGATKTTLSISPASSTITGGSTYSLTAKVSSIGTSLIPSGSVVFEFGAAVPAVTVSLNSSGVATYTGTAPATGILEAEAFYQGQYQGPNLFAGSNSYIPIETIIPASATALSIAPTGTLTAGSLYTLTARVSAVGTSGTPTGHVVFHLGSSTWPVALNSSGIATMTGRAPSAAGRLPLTAVYQGSHYFALSTSNTLNETITAIPTTTALSISPTGSLTAGSAYTLTAKVSAMGSTAVPTGNVIFHIGSLTQTVALGSSGTAIYHGVAPSAAGSLSISAIYQGTIEFMPSTSNALNETIKAIPTTTALSITPTGPLTAGSAYTLTAKVSAIGSTAVPTGNVIFHIGSLTQTVALGSSGTVLYHGVAPSSAGTLSFSAVYMGTTEFAGSSSNTVD